MFVLVSVAIAVALAMTYSRPTRMEPFGDTTAGPSPSPGPVPPAGPPAGQGLVPPVGPVPAAGPAVPPVGPVSPAGPPEGPGPVSPAGPGEGVRETIMKAIQTYATDAVAREQLATTLFQNDVVRALSGKDATGVFEYVKNAAFGVAPDVDLAKVRLKVQDLAAAHGRANDIISELRGILTSSATATAAPSFAAPSSSATTVPSFATPSFATPAPTVPEGYENVRQFYPV